ncbi:hypothetical protein TWF594_004062 [Orbilia oligospora]|uniref:Uncharacterized protein n=1 Tax=Orbilia oligospora TaxID=2813651 RepID=A0A7C8JLS3_ORBOL|nr:hypothetical protein TWF703_007632 [Orbilia oligospora]KAF3152366.1 hypothetical protein TWF594_004062 [Orbilia oligospora]
MTQLSGQGARGIYQPPAAQETRSYRSWRKRRRSHTASRKSVRSRRRKGREFSEGVSVESGPDDTSSNSSSHSSQTTSSEESVASDKSEFSDGTKWGVEQLSEERKNPDFYDLSSRRIVPFNHRGDNVNAIPLCKRCHDGFDSLRPQVIILPVDLQYSLNVEEQDFRERSENVQGTIRRRLSPSGNQYRVHLLNSRPACVEEKHLNNLEDSDMPGGLYQA